MKKELLHYKEAIFENDDTDIAEKIKLIILFKFPSLKFTLRDKCIFFIVSNDLLSNPSKNHNFKYLYSRQEHSNCKFDIMLLSYFLTTDLWQNTFLFLCSSTTIKQNI